MHKAKEKLTKPGTLIMAATHIGKLADTPKRTLLLLKEAALLIFEEDRHARSLLKEAGITKSYLKYNEHHQKDTLDVLEETLTKGNTALYASDQGAPTIADPGHPLLQLAYRLKAKVQVIPGPSSITAAISACPFDLSAFIFLGFLPTKQALRKKKLNDYLQLNKALIILETPYRRQQLLEFLKTVAKLKKRKLFLALDITGAQEAYYAGSLTDLIRATHQTPKCNFVLIIDSNN